MKLRAFGILFILMSFSLSACGSLPFTTPTPLPTVVLGAGSSQSSQAGKSSSLAASSNSGSTSASGIIAPAQSVQIAAAMSARLSQMDLVEGDTVAAGQVLVKLSGTEKLTAAFEAANLELLSARQALKTLKDNADQALTAAQLRLANAQKAFDDAQKRRTAREFRNGSQSQIDGAQANLILANNALKTAHDVYSSVAGAADDDVNKAAALNALSAAQQARDRALANLNYLLALPNKIDVNQAEAGLASAQAEMDAAQKQFDDLKRGPDPDALALAQQRVTNAQAQVAAAQADLDDLVLKAPFTGTVSKISKHRGEWALPGEVILTLADLSHLQVETTDLSERNVPLVKVGQSARVFIKAIGLNVNGQVKEISPLADTLGGDVVYKTIITFDSLPADARSGMSVDVSFGTAP